MKKILALLLALCMIFALAACGAEKEESAEESRSAERSERRKSDATEEKEEAPAEEAPAEEAPAEEAPAEEAPAEEAPAEEAFDVVGTWSAPIDLIKIMAATSPEAAEMFGEGPINMEMLLIFAEDGTVTGDANLDEAIPALKAAMVPYMTQMIEEQFGMTLEDFEAAAGMTLDELLDQQLDPDAIKESFADKDMNGTYVVDGDKVIINGKDENALTIKDGTLVIDSPEMGEMIFTRK